MNYEDLQSYTLDYLVQEMAGSLKVCIDFQCLAKCALSCAVKVHTSQLKLIFCPSPAKGEVEPTVVGTAGVENTYLTPGCRLSSTTLAEVLHTT